MKNNLIPKDQIQIALKTTNNLLNSDNLNKNYLGVRILAFLIKNGQGDNNSIESLIHTVKQNKNIENLAKKT